MPGRGGNHGPYGRHCYVLCGVATLAIFSAAPAVARYEPPWSTVEGAYAAGYIMEGWYAGLGITVRLNHSPDTQCMVYVTYILVDFYGKCS